MKAATRLGMAGKDRLAEQIRYHTELLRLVWLSSLAIGGGTLSFLFDASNPLKLAVGVAGAVAELLFVVVLIHLNQAVRTRISELPEG